MKSKHLWISTVPEPTSLADSCPSPKPEVHPYFQFGHAPPSVSHHTPGTLRRRVLAVALLVCVALLALLRPVDPAQFIASLNQGGAAFSRAFKQTQEGYGRLEESLTTQNDQSGEVVDVHARVCQSWDPDAPEKDDPADCLNVKQYRQVQKAIEYFNQDWTRGQMWMFTRDHNLQALRKISTCFLPETDPSYTSCPDKPLILSGYWWTAVSMDGSTSGEAVWQGSLMKQAETLGISVLAVGGYERWIEVAELLRDVYRVIWLSDTDIVTCASDPRCIAKEHYVPPTNSTDLSIGVPDDERGIIPLHQLTVVDYWGNRPRHIANDGYWWGLQDDEEWSFHPLGHKWVATPFPLPADHLHLPYSIEETCMAAPTRAHAERNESVLLFAKKAAHFYEPLATKPTMFTQLADGASFDVLTTAGQESESQPIPPGLKSLGRQTRPAYDELLSSVKAVIGIGFPYISPTVYAALCQGTPVVVPYFKEEPRSDGWNMYGNSIWQHGPAAALKPPYVYSYYSKDYESLEKAVKQAVETPIERYIPPDMKLEYTTAALKAYLDRDSEAMFNETVQKNGGKVPALAQGLLERQATFYDAVKVFQDEMDNLPV